MVRLFRLDLRCSLFAVAWRALGFLFVLAVALGLLSVLAVAPGLRICLLKLLACFAFSRL
jgi:hypothetical protein